jgi:uncharacterized beta-barrel protein YwiB (DUF1934 family)
MQEVIIDIKGTQIVDGDKDVVSMNTVGQMNIIGGKTYLKYDDSVATGVEGVSCLIKIDPEDKSVIMQRSGTLNSRMYIKMGQRHICHYETGQGVLTMGVFGETVENSITEKGGKLYMSYTLDVNNNMMSRNLVEIDVKQA